MWILLIVAIETAGIAFGSFQLYGMFEEISSKSIMISFVFPALYIAAGFFFRPHVDMDDLGWFGGLMNNPFRFTDDYNRTMLMLRIVFLPGLLLATPYAILLRRMLGREQRPQSQTSRRLRSQSRSRQTR